MSSIRVLDPALASQVAAGEVIESPAAVVRELVDNALDAQATSIEVSLEQGGRGRIFVRDNGVGMDKQDLLLAFERHATSKLKTAEQLTNIHSLGFRGEALPSIAAVARLRLRSKLKGEERAWETRWAGGVHEGISEVAARAGSCVEVEELFFNLPARRKFLGTASAQSRAVDRLLRQQALAFPEVGFRFLLDGKLHWQRPAKQSLAQRASLLVPEADELWPVEAQIAQVGDLQGLMSGPGQGRKSQAPQFFVLRRRVVETPLLRHALRRAYQNYLSSEQPLVLVHLQPEPELLIDWNVHPAKREVRFAQEKLVEDGLVSAFTQALAQGAGNRRISNQSLAKNEQNKHQLPSQEALHDAQAKVSSKDQDHSQAAAKKAAQSSEFTSSVREFEAGSYGQSLGQSSFKQAMPLKPELPQALEREQEQLSLPNFESEVPSSGVGSHGGIFGKDSDTPPQWLGLLPPEYALLEQQKGLLIADLRAVLERLAAARLRLSDGQEDGQAASQTLLIPLTAQFNAHEFESVMSLQEHWQKSGWQLEEFGLQSILVRAVPAAWPTLDANELPQLLLELSHAPQQWQARQYRAWARFMLQQNQPLEAPVAQRWLEELWECNQPYLTPSGRATVWWITQRELARRFAR